MLWKGNQQELELFHNHLNQQMSTIFFTMESSQEQAVFLDLQITKGSRFREKKILDVSLHVKKTNPQNFLQYSSCHPPATFTTIIRGEILRAVRCTSNYLAYTTILDRLLEKFKSRGYPEWLIRQTAEHINFQDRKKLLQPAPKRTLEENTTVFCTTYTPAINSSAIRKMLVDPETPFNPMVLMTRPTSIQDRLVSSGGSRIYERGGHKIMDLLSVTKTSKWEVVKISASPKRPFFFFFCGLHAIFPILRTFPVQIITKHTFSSVFWPQIALFSSLSFP